MNPRATALLVLLGIAAGPVAAGAGAADTILRRPVDEAESAVVLGPTRQQGDFGEHLDELLAAEPAAVETPAPAVPAAPDERQPPLILPVLGGIAGGAIGLYGGGYLGYLIDEGEGGGDWDGFVGAVLGGLIGEIVLLPLGVHMGNARLGSYGIDLGFSSLTGVAGLGLIGVAGSAGAMIAVGAQLGSVVWAERRRARQRIEARSAAGAP